MNYKDLQANIDPSSNIKVERNVLDYIDLLKIGSEFKTPANSLYMDYLSHCRQAESQEVKQNIFNSSLLATGLKIKGGFVYGATY